MNEIRPLPLLLKAISLFILANLLFALLNPPVGRISLYNTLLPGRTRFPFGDGIVDTNITVDDVDAMFAAHVISAPKTPNEYRVIILGDSSIWGTILPADQTLDAKLNQTQFACPGKTLRFYNLGYPHPSVLRDLYMLQLAQKYQPDLVIWPITATSLRTKPLNTFLVENFEPVMAFIKKYNLTYNKQIVPPSTPAFFDKTIIGQRNQLSRLLLLQSLALPWAATGLDLKPVHHYPKLSNDMSGSLTFSTLPPTTNVRSLLLLDYLKTGVQISADAPVLFVNEPIFVATGRNSHKRYNNLYPRWAYDQYRKIMGYQANINGWHYVDLWNVIPREEFSDYELHLSPQGEQRMANALKAPIEKIVCP